MNVQKSVQGDYNKIVYYHVNEKKTTTIQHMKYHNVLDPTAQ